MTNENGKCYMENLLSFGAGDVLSQQRQTRTVSAMAPYNETA
jgi:hypothetical protein